MVRQSLRALLAISSLAIMPPATGSEIANKQATPGSQADAVNPSTAGFGKVTQHMAAAHAALSAADASGNASRAQRKVVEELDSMIAQLQKQCEKCGGQCSKSASSSKPPQMPSAKRGSKPGETTAAAKTRAPGRMDRAAVSNLVKDIWGRLPERQREELLQPLSEEFLPEYAEDIEEYFRALAETPPEEGAAEKQP
jgi:hypothetical protein